MDAVGVLLMGAGLWLLYSAYKGEDPLTVFKTVLAANSAANSVDSTPMAGSGQSVTATPVITDQYGNPVTAQTPQAA